MNLNFFYSTSEIKFSPFPNRIFQAENQEFPKQQRVRKCVKTSKFLGHFCAETAMALSFTNTGWVPRKGYWLLPENWGMQTRKVLTQCEATDGSQSKC